MTKKHCFPFSGKLYLQTLKRLRIVGAVSAAVLAVANIIFGAAAYKQKYVYFYDSDTGSILPRAGVDVFMPTTLALTLLISVIMAFIAFSFLFDRHKSDFYHSLPQNRTGVYFSTCAASLTWVWGIILVFFAGNLLYLRIIHGAEYTVDGVFEGFSAFAWLTPVRYMIATFMLTAFVALACSLTGTKVPAVTAFLVLAFGIRLIVVLSYGIFIQMTPILSQSAPYTDYAQMYAQMYYDYAYDNSLIQSMTRESTFLSNMTAALSAFGESRVLGLYFPLSCITDGLMVSPWEYYVNTGIGALTAVLGCVAFARRKSDTAGKPAPNRILQAFYRVFAALPAGIIAAACVISAVFVYQSDSKYYYILAAVTGAASIVIFCVYELAVSKSIKKMLRATATLPILLLLCAAYAAGVFIARAAVYSYVPSADDIASVNAGRWAHTDNDSGKRYPPIDLIITSQEGREYISKIYAETVKIDTGSRDYNHYMRKSVTITDKNGRQYTRDLLIGGDDGTYSYGPLNKLYLLAYDENYVLPPHKGYKLGIGSPYKDYIIETQDYIRGYGSDMIATDSKGRKNLANMLEEKLRTMTDEELAAYYESCRGEFELGKFCIELTDCLGNYYNTRTYYTVPVGFYEIRQEMINRQNSIYASRVDFGGWIDEIGGYTDDDQTAPRELLSFIAKQAAYAKKAEVYQTDMPETLIYPAGAVVCTNLRILSVNAKENEETELSLSAGHGYIGNRILSENGGINEALAILNDSEKKLIYPDARECYAYVEAEFMQGYGVWHVKAVISITESDYAALKELS